VLGLAPHFVSPQPVAAGETEDRAAVLARWETLQNVSVQYQLREQRDEPTTGKRQEWEKHYGKQSAWLVMGKNGVTVKACSFSFLRSAARFEEQLANDAVRRVESMDAVDQKYRLLTFTQDRFEELLEAPQFNDDGKPAWVTWSTKGHISSPLSRQYYADAVIDVALGLRPPVHAGPDNTFPWLTPERLKAMRYSVVDEDRFILEEKTSSYESVSRWMFRRKPAAWLVSCTQFSPELNHAWRTIDNEAPLEVRDEAARERATLLLPSKVTQAMFSRSTSGEWHSWTATLDVAKYALGDPSNDADRYRIRWPAGVEVLLYWERAGEVRKGAIRIQDEGEPLDDAAIEHALKPEKATQTPPKDPTSHPR
jgi:hypothetical protein